MKRLIGFGAYLVWSWVAAAQGTFVVVPNGLAGVEGNSSTSDPFSSSSFRLQQVFDSSQFAFLGSSTCRIDAIYFRIDGAATENAVYSFGGSSIQLSTTTADPDSLSPIFSDNVGPDVVTVYSGGTAFGDHFNGSLSPQPFNRFSVSLTPFFYSPSQGNLLLDIAAAGGLTLFPGRLDAEDSASDGVSRVYALNGNLTSGTADSLGLVTRFDITIIPEPSPEGILLVTTLLAVLLKSAIYRKSKRLSATS